LAYFCSTPTAATLPVRSPINRLETLCISTQYNNCYNALERPMFTLKLTQIGNSVGVILPREMLARLKLEKGGTVFVTETPGGFALTPYDPAIDEQLKAVREFMQEYRDTLHQLAK
jgi:putative addiction module antidote